MSEPVIIQLDAPVKRNSILECIANIFQCMFRCICAPFNCAFDTAGACFNKNELCCMFMLLFCIIGIPLIIWGSEKRHTSTYNPTFVPTFVPTFMNTTNHTYGPSYFPTVEPTFMNTTNHTYSPSLAPILAVPILVAHLRRV